MRNITAIQFIIIAALSATLTACDDNNDFDQMPSQIQSFVSEYYPGISVADYSFDDGTYHVTLSNSAYLRFNSSISWITVDGRGATLPRQLLYDQLPTILYQYLETTSNVGDVYSATRTTAIYTLSLLDSTVVYDIATQKITQ